MMPEDARLAWRCNGGVRSCADICLSHPKGSFPTVDSVIDHYISMYRNPAACEMSFYANQKTFEKAIERAALCKLCDDKVHPHQSRRFPRPPEALREAYDKLLANKERLKVQDTFDNLHELVNGTISSIWEIGPLTIYDISHRIGAFLKLEPEFVYLHAGALMGARILGFSAKTGDKLTKEEFIRINAEFGQLAPSEIEDCLCLYRKYLGKR